MKKSSILITAFLLIFQFAKAQTQKGDQNLGLSLSFNSGNNDSYYQSSGSSLINSTSFSVMPNYSYFIADKLDIGAGIGYGQGNDKFNYPSQILTNGDVTYNLSTMVYLRKYYLFNNKIGIRTGPYFSFQHYSTHYNYVPDINQPDYTSKTINYQAGLNVDFVYYPLTKIGLAVNIGSLYYNRNKANGYQFSSNSSSVNLQFLNNNLQVSAFYVFGN